MDQSFLPFSHSFVLRKCGAFCPSVFQHHLLSYRSASAVGEQVSEGALNVLTDSAVDFNLGVGIPSMDLWLVEPMILLPQLLQCWDYRHDSCHLVSVVVFICIITETSWGGVRTVDILLFNCSVSSWSPEVSLPLVVPKYWWILGQCQIWSLPGSAFCLQDGGGGGAVLFTLDSWHSVWYIH